jgi:hypothetical protein
MTLAEQIREFASSQHIKPARKTSAPYSTLVKIVSGDLVKEMRLKDRTPAVCGALDAKKFQDEYEIELLQRTGPKHGTTTTWTFLV